MWRTLRYLHAPTTAVSSKTAGTGSPSALTRDYNYIVSNDNDDDDNELTAPYVSDHRLSLIPSQLARL